MSVINPLVDAYLADGCGRCELYATPQCKVKTWLPELEQLRAIVLSCGLTEELKWKQPCYTHKGKNILLVTAFNDYSCIAFFKGALLKDTKGLLVFPGPNSQAAKQMRFTDVQDIIKQEPIIKAYIKEAIKLEDAGKQIAFKKEPEALPEELTERLKKDARYKRAFEALTPGRQRSYILHISGAKQSATRASRVEKCLPKILAGKGFNEY